MPHPPGTEFDSKKVMAGLLGSEGQYPLDQPEVAVRNYLREHGIVYNPFGPYAKRAIQRAATNIGGMYPMSLMDKGDFEGGSAATDFAAFIDRYLTGAVQRPSMSDITSNLSRFEDKSSNWRGLFQTGGGSPQDLLHAAAQARLQDQISPIELAMIGMYNQPEDLARLYGQAYSPVLGQTGSAHMMRALAPAIQAYGDYLGEPLEMSNSSLLGLLLGQFNAPLGPASLGRPAAAVPSPGVPDMAPMPTPGRLGGFPVEASQRMTEPTMRPWMGPGATGGMGAEMWPRQTGGGAGFREWLMQMLGAR